MHDLKDQALPAQGTSDPQGPAGGGGVVPAPPPSLSDDGPSPVSRVGTGEQGTTTPIWWRRPARALPDMAEAAREWNGFFDSFPRSRDLPSSEVEELRIFLRNLVRLLRNIEDAEQWILSGSHCVPDPCEDAGGASPNTRDACVGTQPLPTRCVAAQTEVGGQPPSKEGKGPCLPKGKPTAGPLPHEVKRPSIASHRAKGGGALMHPLPRGEGCKPPLKKGSGGDASPPSEEKSGRRSSTPLDRGGGRSYAEAARGPPQGKSSASSLGGCGSPSKVGKGRGTRGGRVTIRVPNIGDIGLLGLGTGDLVIKVPGPTAVEAGRRAFEPTGRTRSGVGASTPSPRARKKRGSEGLEARCGVAGTADIASPAMARCYRCLVPGHLAAYCGGPDRRLRCYRCGDTSCRWRRCSSDLPKCPLCVDLGRSFEHVLGAGNCRWRIPGRRKRGRFKSGRESDEPSPPLTGEESGSSASGSCG